MRDLYVEQSVMSGDTSAHEAFVGVLNALALSLAFWSLAAGTVLLLAD